MLTKGSASGIINMNESEHDANTLEISDLPDEGKRGKSF